MSTQYTVTYFNLQGRAETIRMILSYAKADWKDIRFPFVAPGQTHIPDDIKERLRFGQVPLLEFDGKRLVQSMTICRYLAKKFDLVGKDEFEAAQADEVVDACNDILTILIQGPMYETDATKKAEGLKEAEKTIKECFLSKLNETAESSGYLVGDQLTWADIVLTNTLLSLGKATGIQFLNDFPALTSVTKKVLDAPGIKEWIAKRPDNLY